MRLGFDLATAPEAPAVPMELLDYLDCPDIRGRTPDGPARWSYYLFGADLAALRRAGVRLSWSAARVLHVGARLPLDRLHQAGIAHGALTPRRVRMTFFQTPYTAMDRGIQDRPVRLCGHAPRALDAALAEAELSTLAAAIAALGEHADPGVAALLRERSPESTEALATLLLARAQPIDELLRDWLRGGGDRASEAAATLPTLPPPDDDIAAELRALWLRVAELDPLLR